MDTVNVSSRVRTIAYTMYRTPVQYSIHYLCNVNNTPSSDSWCCFSLTVFHRKSLIESNDSSWQEPFAAIKSSPSFPNLLPTFGFLSIWTEQKSLDLGFFNLSFQFKELWKLIQVQQIATHDLFSGNYGLQGNYLKNLTSTLFGNRTTSIEGKLSWNPWISFPSRFELLILCWIIVSVDILFMLSGFWLKTIWLNLAPQT